MWDLPRPGLEPVSPALAGRFSTTAPPGKAMAKFYQSLDAGNWRMHHHLLNIMPFIVKTHGDPREVKMWRRKSYIIFYNAHISYIIYSVMHRRVWNAEAGTHLSVTLSISLSTSLPASSFILSLSPVPAASHILPLGGARALGAHSASSRPRS